MVRRVVRWESHIEHAMKEPIHYITNVADGHLVIEIFNRVRFPQCMSVAQRKELLPVNVARLVHWHDGRKRVPARAVVLNDGRCVNNVQNKVLAAVPGLIETRVIIIITYVSNTTSSRNSSIKQEETADDAQKSTWRRNGDKTHPATLVCMGFRLDLESRPLSEGSVSRRPTDTCSLVRRHSVKCTPMCRAASHPEGAKGTFGIWICAASDSSGEMMRGQYHDFRIRD